MIEVYTLAPPHRSGRSLSQNLARRASRNAGTRAGPVAPSSTFDDVRVPALDELSELFEDDPVSVAEVSLGRFMGLERWPEGEVRLASTSGGVSVVLTVNPGAGRVAVELLSPAVTVSLALTNVAELRISKLHGIHELTIEFERRAALEPLRLRLLPDARLLWGMAASAP